MPSGDELASARLLMRRWRASDREPFAALNDDPRVMEYFPARLTRAESDQLIDAIEAGFEQRGYGFWALELRASGEFLGFTGVSEVMSFKAPFTPSVEVGWRLALSAWGHGYATEAARASLAFGFQQAGLDQIICAATSSTGYRLATGARDGHQPRDRRRWAQAAIRAPLRAPPRARVERHHRGR